LAVLLTSVVTLAVCALEPTLPVQSTVQVSFPAAGLAWDSGRKALYLSDQAGLRVVKIGLAEGQVAGNIAFEPGPEALFVSPDGRFLYVGQPAHPHADNSSFPQEGVIGVVDTATFTKVREFEVAIDPYELVATDTGFVVVSSGSDQWTRIRSYDAATGAVCGGAMIRQRSRLALHPSQDCVYAADTDSGPSDIQRFDLDPATGAGLAYAAADDLTPLGSFPVPSGANFVGGHGELHYAVGMQGSETLISRRRFPAVDEWWMLTREWAAP
jgi:DNA-binding beta-propeller fold protein YncE